MKPRAVKGLTVTELVEQARAVAERWRTAYESATPEERRRMDEALARSDRAAAALGLGRVTAAPRREDGN